MVKLENMVKWSGLGLFLTVSGCNDMPHNFAEPMKTVISPEEPKQGEHLLCEVQGSDDPFDFYWLVNEDTILSQTGYLSALHSSYLASGDLVECAVWVPESGMYDGFQIGYDRTYIE